VQKILKIIVANYEEIPVKHLLKFIISVRGCHGDHLFQVPKK